MKTKRPLNEKKTYDDPVRRRGFYIICGLFTILICCAVRAKQDEAVTEIEEYENRPFALDFSKPDYNYREIAEYICAFEGYSPSAYSDPGGGFSIGCGSLSFMGDQKMDYETAINIVAREAKRLSDEIYNVYGSVSQKEIQALVSIRYNTPQKRSITTDPRVITYVKMEKHEKLKDFYESQIQHVEKSVGYSLNGLRHRREHEIALLFNQI